MRKKQMLSALCGVLLSFTMAAPQAAAEHRSNEILVAMASSKSVCGGNTGKACPGTAPATVSPPVAASPVIPAPKPAPAPVQQQPAPITVPQQPAPVIVPQQLAPSVGRTNSAHHSCCAVGARGGDATSVHGDTFFNQPARKR